LRRRQVLVAGLAIIGASLAHAQRTRIVRLGFLFNNIALLRSPFFQPFEQPSKFELAINSKAARAMGLVIPRSLLVRADRVIE